jgi:flagellar protein FlbT
MPLQIKLPAWDKIIINGAVLQNGGSPSTLVVHNRADILRRKEVMSEDQANTPARRAYYCLQCAYLFEEQRGEFIEKFTEFMEAYIRAAPSVTGVAEEVFDLLQEERYYDGLRMMRRVIEHEEVRLGRVKELLEGQVGGGGLGGEKTEGQDFVEDSMRRVTEVSVKTEHKRRRRKGESSGEGGGDGN